MAKTRKPLNPDYEDLAATYQVAATALLNSVLKACGIKDRKNRIKICAEFMFAHGSILDEGAFQENGKWYAPVVSFVELRGNPEAGFRRTKATFEAADDFCGYHEYAFGNIDYFFDECKEKTDFDWGPEYE